MLRVISQRQLVIGWGHSTLAGASQHSRLHKQVLHERGTVPAHRDTDQAEQHSLVARETEVAL